MQAKNAQKRGQEALVIALTMLYRIENCETELSELLDILRIPLTVEFSRIIQFNKNGRNKTSLIIILMLLRQFYYRPAGAVFIPRYLPFKKDRKIPLAIPFETNLSEGIRI